MRLRTISEYRKELDEWYRELQETHPEELESLGVTDDLEVFQWEMTMLGVVTSKRHLSQLNHCVSTSGSMELGDIGEMDKRKRKRK